MRRKKSKHFPPLFETKHFCRMDFLETWIRAITQSIPFISNKNDVFVPLPSWCTTDDMTNRKTDRQTERQLKARGTSRRPHLLSVIISRSCDVMTYIYNHVVALCSLQTLHVHLPCTILDFTLAQLNGAPEPD